MKRKAIKISPIILASAMALSASASAFAGEYRVKKGDCLWKIANELDTTWRVLADMNSLSNPDLIFPDQILQVPGSETVVKAVQETAAEETVEIVAEAQNEAAAELASLDVKDIAMTGTKLEPDFSADVTEYTVNVQDDIYGVKITPTAAEGASVYIDGEEIAKGESYIAALDQSVEGYGKDYSVDCVIKAVSGDDEKDYTVHIVRENAADVYAPFHRTHIC